LSVGCFFVNQFIFLCCGCFCCFVVVSAYNNITYIEGNLGIGTISHENKARHNTILSKLKIKEWFVGLYHNFVITQDDQVYAFGFNHSGQLGIGDLTDRPEPTLIPSLSRFYTIAPGSNSTFAITRNDHQVYGWGDNSTHDLLLDDSNNTFSPTRIPFFNDKFICKIVARGTTFYAQSINGKIYAWGNNQFLEISSTMLVRTVKTPQILSEFAYSKEILPMAERVLFLSHNFKLSSQGKALPDSVLAIVKTRKVYQAFAAYNALFMVLGSSNMENMQIKLHTLQHKKQFTNVQIVLYH